MKKIKIKEYKKKIRYGVWDAVDGMRNAKNTHWVRAGHKSNDEQYKCMKTVTDHAFYYVKEKEFGVFDVYKIRCHNLKTYTDDKLPRYIKLKVAFLKTARPQVFMRDIGYRHSENEFVITSPRKKV